MGTIEWRMAMALVGIVIVLGAAGLLFILIKKMTKLRVEVDAARADNVHQAVESVLNRVIGA